MNSTLGIFLVLASATLLVSAQYYSTIQVGNIELDISNFELPWSTAIQACVARNKTLLSVETPEKDKLLVDILVGGTNGTVLPGNNSWISATESREGAWIWQPSGEPLYHSRWYIGQPDDLTSINCAYQAVTAQLYWRDANCSAPMYFICESNLLV